MRNLKDQGKRELEHKVNLMWRPELIRKQSLDAPSAKSMVTTLQGVIYELNWIERLEREQNSLG
jgi:hypothetical protein